MCACELKVTDTCPPSRLVASVARPGKTGGMPEDSVKQMKRRLQDGPAEERELAAEPETMH